MKKTGQFLKDKRESANLSLSEVALATKINPKILFAIENGDEKSLPAKTFLKGFLRAYATFLKIDADEVLRIYQEESGGPPPERIHEVNMPQGPQPAGGRARMGEENSSGLRTAAVVVIVLLIGVIIGVRELIEKYQREKSVDNSPIIKVSPLAQPPLLPETNKPAETTAAPSAELVPQGTAETATPEPPAKPVQSEIVNVPPAEPKAEVTPAQPKVIESKPVEVKPPEEPNVAESKEVKEEPTAATKSMKNEIILEALDKVDVKFQIKGETKKLTLAPTQVHTIHSDQPITLDLSDGGAVNIILNGHERGVPGDLGKPKQIKIP